MKMMSCTTTMTIGGTKLGTRVRLVVSFASSGQQMTTRTLIRPTTKTRRRHYLCLTDLPRLDILQIDNMTIKNASKNDVQNVTLTLLIRHNKRGKKEGRLPSYRVTMDPSR
jgi:hypothetical protein